MTEKEKQIIKTFVAVLPKLNDTNKTYLLGFGEGLAAAVTKPQQPSAG